MGRIWYLEHPTFRYEQDVKALAKEAGLTIIDPAGASPDLPDAADDVPAVTLRAEYRQPREQDSAPAADAAPKQPQKAKAGKTTAPKDGAPAADQPATHKE